MIASSGSGAMEGAVTNLFSKGDRVLVVDGGKFGERWVHICKAYGVDAQIIKLEWGQAVDPAVVSKHLQKGGIRGVLVQASESSTGVYHPIKELAKVTQKQKDCLLVVDAISALGALDLPMDDWGIDLLLAASQKALGLPPGLAFAALSDKAWAFVEKSTLPKFYFNFLRNRKKVQSNETSFTPPIQLVMGLEEVLRQLKEEGLSSVFARHARLAQATRAGLQGMGLRLFAQSPANSLTAVYSPEGIDGQKVFKTLQEKYNVTIAGGQDQAKGKIFRISHLGFYDDLDMVTVLTAVEWTLADLGYKFQMGSGVTAAMKVLNNPHE